MSEPFD